MRIQIGSSNIASGNDAVAVQAGKVHGRGGEQATPDVTPPAGQAGAAAGGAVANIRSGNARVGEQADVVTSGIVLRYE